MHALCGRSSWRPLFLPVTVRRVSAELLLVAVAAVPIAALCRRYGLSAPLILVTVGLAVGWIPGMPEVMLDPDLVLFLILPPLLLSLIHISEPTRPY